MGMHPVQVIAVTGGKGGVGKTNVSVNLALALADLGRRVMLMDADLGLANVDVLLGLTPKKTLADVISGDCDMRDVLIQGPGGIRVVPAASGTQSMVQLTPMQHAGLIQAFSDISENLDVLIVDLPPGTGDVQMTLAQKTDLNGAIIVSTPQDIALLDARKGIDMFNQLGTPIIGMIENMSTHICSKCGHEEHMFGHGGVATEAKKLGVPLLAEIPLHMDIRLAADGGAPIVVSKPDSPQAKVFRAVAKDLIAKGHA